MLALVLALVAFRCAFVQAQTLTTLAASVRDGFVSPRNPPAPDSDNTTGDKAAIPQRPGLATRKRPRRRGSAHPDLLRPAASGASTSGYDSLNRTRKRPKFYRQARPKPARVPEPCTPLIAAGGVVFSSYFIFFFS